MSPETTTSHCPICECGHLSPVTRDESVQTPSGLVTVPDVTILICDSCGEGTLTGQLAKVFSRKVNAARRQKDNLLTPDEIVAIRQRLRVSQAQFEAMLGLGAKTMVRWENDTQVQSVMMDNLLRLIRRDPDNAVFLSDIRQMAG